MIDSGDKLKLDQTHLETVIPAPGKSLCRPFNTYTMEIRDSIPTGHYSIIQDMSFLFRKM